MGYQTVVVAVLVTVFVIPSVTYLLVVGIGQTDKHSQEGRPDPPEMNHSRRVIPGTDQRDQ